MPIPEKPVNAAEWVTGLEATYAAMRCDQADPDDSNECVDSDGELEWPDDYCLRCYTLQVVRVVADALGVPADA